MAKSSKKKDSKKDVRKTKDRGSQKIRKSLKGKKREKKEQTSSSSGSRSSSSSGPDFSQAELAETMKIAETFGLNLG